MILHDRDVKFTKEFTQTLKDAGMIFAPLKEMIEKEIDQVADNINAHYVHGILIARYGKLVFEDYFHET